MLYPQQDIGNWSTEERTSFSSGNPLRVLLVCLYASLFLKIVSIKVVFLLLAYISPRARLV